MKWVSWIVLLLGLLSAVAYAEFRETGGYGITFSDSVPSPTTNMLYRSGSALYWSGTLISSGS